MILPFLLVILIALIKFNFPRFFKEARSVLNEKIGWCAECDLDEMFEDTWCWQCMNPNGYSKIRTKE